MDRTDFCCVAYGVLKAIHEGRGQSCGVGFTPSQLRTLFRAWLTPSQGCSPKCTLPVGLCPLFSSFSVAHSSIFLWSQQNKMPIHASSRTVTPHLCSLSCTNWTLKILICLILTLLTNPSLASCRNGTRLKADALAVPLLFQFQATLHMLSCTCCVSAVGWEGPRVTRTASTPQSGGQALH